MNIKKLNLASKLTHMKKYVLIIGHIYEVYSRGPINSGEIYCL